MPEGTCAQDGAPETRVLALSRWCRTGGVVEGLTRSRSLYATSTSRAKRPRVVAKRHLNGRVPVQEVVCRMTPCQEDDAGGCMMVEALIAAVCCGGGVLAAEEVPGGSLRRHRGLQELPNTQSATLHRKSGPPETASTTECPGDVYACA